MANTRKDIEKTERGRQVVLAFVREHPDSSVRDVAAAGLYTSTRATVPERAALCWVRTHLVALADEGKVEVVRDGAVLRYRAT